MPRGRRRQRNPSGGLDGAEAGLRVSILGTDGEPLPEYAWSGDVVKAVARNLAGGELDFIGVVSNHEFVTSIPDHFEAEEWARKWEGIDNWLAQDVVVESIPLSIAQFTEVANQQSRLTQRLSTTSSSRSVSSVTNRKAPKLGLFSGENERNKEFVGYPQWKYTVRSLLKTRDEETVKECIMSSLRGNAFDVVRYMGDEATSMDILEKLDMFYGVRMEHEIMMKELFAMKQSHQESVVSFATNLEGQINDIRAYHPERMTAEAARGYLRDRLWGGLQRVVKRDMKHWFDDPSVTYEDLLREAIKRETVLKKDGQDGPTLFGKAKMVRPAPDEDEDDESDDEDEQQQPSTTPSSSEVSVKGTSCSKKGVVLKGKPMEGVEDEDRAALVKLAKDLMKVRDTMEAAMVPPPHRIMAPQQDPWRPNRKRGIPLGSGFFGRKQATPEDQCYRCRGFGHFAYQCPTQNLNAKGEGEHGSPPQPQNQEQ